MADLVNNGFGGLVIVVPVTTTGYRFVLDL